MLISGEYLPHDFLSNVHGLMQVQQSQIVMQLEQKICHMTAAKTSAFLDVKKRVLGAEKGDEYNNMFCCINLLVHV